MRCLENVDVLEGEAGGERMVEIGRRGVCGVGEDRMKRWKEGSGSVFASRHDFVFERKRGMRKDRLSISFHA